MLTTPDFIERLNSLKGIEEQIDFIFDIFDEFLFSRRFEEVDDFLDTVDPAELKLHSALAILSATYSYREKLSKRPAYRNKCKKIYQTFGFFS